MNAAIADRAARRLARRQRELITPEGLTLPLTIATRGARAGALVLDLVLIAVTLFVVALVLAMVGLGMLGAGSMEEISAPVELVLVLLVMLLFLARYGYFLWFELGPRGATPGKRLMGIRVAARGGGALNAEAVIARNLLRDAEVFVPLVFLTTGQAGSGLLGVATFVWLAVFVLFPFFNRDNLRAGDLVAGTWVVEEDRRKLPEAMSLRPAIASAAPPQYRFGDAELAVYGEHELQVLESVLRQTNPAAMREVADAICVKIGWQAGTGDEREFLEAFYAALRAHLERGLRFGKRKKNKFE